MGNVIDITDDNIDLGVNAAILHINGESDVAKLQNGNAGLELKNNGGASTANLLGIVSVNDEGPVIAGANDSGGAGYRALVIPNT